MKYNFEQGDIYLADLSPVMGHEEHGIRPVLIVSNSDFNHITRLTKVVAITSKLKEFPSRVALPIGMKTNGQILTENERAIDLSVRQIKFVEHCPEEVLTSVLELIQESY